APGVFSMSMTRSNAMDALDLAMRDGWSAPSVHLGVAPGEGARRLVGRPGGELEVQRLDALELRPVPVLAAEGPPLGGEERTVGALDLRHVGLDPEAVA